MRPWGPQGALLQVALLLLQLPGAHGRPARCWRAAYAALADRVVERTGKAVALICMEQLDEAIARPGAPLHDATRSDARVFSAREHDASRMTALLRGLDLLVTSRYHAAVLSLAAAVPQIAVGHDTRLDTLYRDLGLREEWFSSGAADDLASGSGARALRVLRERVDAAPGALPGCRRNAGCAAVTRNTWPAPGRTAEAARPSSLGRPADLPRPLSQRIEGGAAWVA